MLQSVLPSVSQAKGSAALCSVFFGEWLNARFEQLCDGHRLLQFAIPPPFLLLLLPPRTTWKNVSVKDISGLAAPPPPKKKKAQLCCFFGGPAPRKTTLKVKSCITSTGSTAARGKEEEEVPELVPGLVVVVVAMNQNIKTQSPTLVASLGKLRPRCVADH